MKWHARLLFVMLILCGTVCKTWARGPFVLPIHDNATPINGGAWNYSKDCKVTTEHGGFDFDGIENQTLVYPAADGIVIDVRSYSTYEECTEKAWGCYVDIGHDLDGDGAYEYTTKYAHLYQGSITVTIGDHAYTDMSIAKVGNTGYSEGDHLHFGIQEYGAAQYLKNEYWLDPYNLYGDATCCDILNGGGVRYLVQVWDIDKKVKEYKTTKNTLLIKGLQKDTKFKVRVRAENKKTKGRWSKSLEIHT